MRNIVSMLGGTIRLDSINANKQTLLVSCEFDY